MRSGRPPTAKYLLKGLAQSGWVHCFIVQHCLHRLTLWKQSKGNLTWIFVTNLSFFVAVVKVILPKVYFACVYYTTSS